MALWPVSLPRPNIGGYQLAPVDQTVRTDMEAGSARVRRRTFARNDQVSVTWLFTDAQMAVFRAWFDDPNNAAGGAGWFTVDLAYGDLGLRSREARFIGPWTATPLGGLNWEATARLETRGGELTADQIKGALMGLVTATGQYPSLALDFAGDKALDSRITFARADASACATYFGADGVMRTAPANVPRFDHNPATQESLGLLIEEARTNLVLNSEDVTAASWTGTGATRTANAAVAPSGAVTADLIKEDASNGVHNVYQAAGVSNATAYTWSGYVKAAGRSACRLTCQATATVFVAQFDLSAVTASTISGTGSATITPVGNGWYRITATATSTAAGTAYWQVNLVSGGTNSYTGDGTSGIYIWGAQFEAGAFPSSYIPTTTATVTRAADLASVSGTNFSGWFNASEGTFLAKFNGGKESTSPNYGRVLGYDAGKTFMNMAVSQNQIQAWNGANSFTHLVAGADYWGAGGKAAMAYSNSGRVISGNGYAPTEDAYTIGSPTLLYLGSTAGSYLNGAIRRIAYYPKRLSNTELQALTA